MKLTMIIADDELLALKSEEIRVKKEFPDIEIVATAQDGIEFKNLVLRFDPDIAIVDIRMPGLTGIEAIELLRVKGCRTHFIVNTAYSDFEYVKSALDLKTDGYMLKPAKREEFVRTIEQLCDTIASEKSQKEHDKKINSAIESVIPIIGSEIIDSLLEGDMDEDNFLLYCDLNNILFSAGFIITLRPKAKDAKLPKKEIARSIETILGNACNFLEKTTDKNIIIMVFVPAEISDEDIAEWRNEILRLIDMGLTQTHGIAFLAGAGAVYHSFAEMKESYLESIGAPKPGEIIEKAQTDKAIQYVQKGCEYIASNYAADISLEECANEIGISSWYFSRIFRQIQGQTFIDYLIQFRTTEAKRMCKESDFSIREIAERCGYGNLTYFYKVFKKNTGVTVGQYMDKVRKKHD